LEKEGTYLCRKTTYGAAMTAHSERSKFVERKLFVQESLRVKAKGIWEHLG
jgi:hypothetical protein